MDAQHAEGPGRILVLLSQLSLIQRGSLVNKNGVFVLIAGRWSVWAHVSTGRKNTLPSPPPSDDVTLVKLQHTLNRRSDDRKSWASLRIPVVGSFFRPFARTQATSA